MILRSVLVIVANSICIHAKNLHSVQNICENLMEFRVLKHIKTVNF